MWKLKIKKEFWTIPNILLNNNKISLKAKWLFWYLQSKPDNWDFAWVRIANDCLESKNTVFKILQELEEFWYLERIKYKKENWKFDTDYYLYSAPVTKNREQSTVTKIGDTEIGDTESWEINKERNTNKETIKKNNNILPKNLFEKSSFEYNISKRYLDWKRWQLNTECLIKKKWEENLLQEWADEIRKIKQYDLKNIKDEILKEKWIEFVIEFCLSNEFWFNKWMFSINKLREKSKKDKIPYFIMIAQQCKFEFENNNTNKYEAWILHL